MHIYLVGGAVRDQLLNYPVKDKDWLVTGATVEEMEQLGYRQVGKSFPVFLHPENGQEYALARTEKKSGSGYTGFVCDFSPNITIEEDLLRRDLTINAMAQNQQGDIIDPYHGQQDLKNKVLRHVSNAFAEDPLRILRVARFAARYAHLGFTVAPETLELMTKMVQQGEVDHLIPERIWQETQTALLEQSPQVYFQLLKDCNALQVLMPELDALWGVPNPPQWHPEVDTGVHMMMVLEQVAKLSDDLTTRFAALTHDFGKALTPKETWPRHIGHERAGLKPIKAFCQRLRVPNDCRDLALLTCEYHTHTHKAFELKPTTIVKLFDKLDAWRKPDRFQQFLTACLADTRGRLGFEQSEYSQVAFLKAMLTTANKVDVKDVIQQGYKGPQIRERLSELRCEAIKSAKQAYQK